MLMTIKEACAYAAIGKTHCYKLIAANEIEAAKIGAATRITKRSLDAYIERSIIRADELRTR